MTNKYHYVYRIKNTQLNKHYYGVRSSKTNPKLDLGIKYFSSSTDKEFIKEQKENKDIFKYKVVKIFQSRKEADEHEIFLHKKFDVKSHKQFYNIVNAGAINFTMTGENHWIHSKTAEEIKTIYNKVSTKNKTLIYKQLEKFGHWTENKGKEEVKNIYAAAGNKQRETKSTNEFKEKLKSSVKFQEAVMNKNQKGSNNYNAKYFEIYDSTGKFVASGKGNCVEVCTAVGIKPTAFYRYKNNELGMYHDVNSTIAKAQLKSNGSDKFVGYKILWDI